MSFRLDIPLLAQSTPSLSIPPFSLSIPHFSPSSSKEISYEGVSYEFLSEPPQKFMCSICTQLAKDPHLTACCGHEFCEACLKKWKKTSADCSCPHCRHTKFVHILDKQARREIEELKICCPRRSHGCTWEGELSMIKAHEKECSFSFVKCPQCSNNVLRKDLEKHSSSECPFRESTCPYCGKKDAYSKVISFGHMAECPGYPMDCPNKCGTKAIKRSTVLAHRKTCPLEEIECPLKEAGCSDKTLRKDLEAHVNSKQGAHLVKLMTVFEESQVQLRKQSRELRELRMCQTTTEAVMTRIASNVDQLLEKSLTTQLAPIRSIRSLLRHGGLILNSEHSSILLTVPNYSQLEKTKTATWESLPFYLQEGYKACLTISRRSSVAKEIGAEIRLLRGEFDSELTWPCTIRFNSLYLSLESVGVDASIDLPSVLSRHPYCLSVEGIRHSPVASCSESVPSQILWHTMKLMDSLPPYPSTIRSHYLRNDCLTVKLSWVELPQFAPRLQPFGLAGLNRSLPRLAPKSEESSANAVVPSSSSSSNSSVALSRPVVSVFTSGGDQKLGLDEDASKRVRRRKY